MSGTVLQRKTIAGVDLMVFNPTTQMQLFALTYLCDPEYKGKTPETICEAVGIARNSFDRFLKYEPYFSEWLEKRRLELGGRSRKVALETVGMERALAGEFNFWKAMAIKEGVIDPDKLDIGASLPANLGALKEMNVNDLKALENSVMASLRGENHAGEIAMVEGPQGWEREGDSGGNPEVPESVVLAPKLGADRERALAGLEPF